MIKILILQPFSDQARAIAKYIRMHADTYTVIGGISTQTAIKSIPFFDRLDTIPSDYRVTAGEYDIILPTGSESTNMFMQLHDSLRVGNISFFKENLRVCDKISMLDIIKNLGIPIPKTYKSAEEIDCFPVFYKQRVETGKGSRGIIHEKKELDSIVQDKSVFFQEFIDSPVTYGVAFLARNGVLVTSFIQKELYSYPKPGGSGVILQACEDEKLLEYTRIILDALQFSGWGLVEFKYCPRRKDYVFMEVNAKLWASIEFALMNNPVFFQELFNIRYSPKKNGCVVYLDRLANYGLKEYFSLWASHRHCAILHFKRSVLILAGNAISAGQKKLKTTPQ
jgi:hypothetical protein